MRHRWRRIWSGQLPDSLTFNIPIPTLKRFNSFRDIQCLMGTIPDFASFQTACRLIKSWARERGLYSPKHGYLGGQHITHMLARICYRLAKGGVGSSPTLIVRTFFAYYATFDFEEEVVDGKFCNLKPRYLRSNQEPMVILSEYSPVINVATNVSTYTLQTITKELKRADELMAEENMTWLRVMGIHHSPRESGLQPGAAIDFLRGFETFMRIDIVYWGASTVKCGKLVKWIEGECPDIVAGIAHPRSYPTNLTVIRHQPNPTSPTHQSLAFTLHLSNGQRPRSY